MKKFSMYEFEAQLINDTEYLVKSKYDTFRVVLQNRTSENPRVEVAVIGVAGSYRWQFGYDATGAGPAVVAASMQYGHSIHLNPLTTKSMFATFIYYCGYYLLQSSATCEYRDVALKVRRLDSEVNLFVFEANSAMDSAPLSEKEVKQFSRKAEKLVRKIQAADPNLRTRAAANLLWLLDTVIARIAKDGRD